MKKIYLLSCVFLLTCLFSFFDSIGQNLIVNPSAELEPVGNGWIADQTIGTDCSTSNNSSWNIEGDQDGFPAAHTGTYFFFPGCDGIGGGAEYEIYQAIDISNDAATVDADAYLINFSGYMRSGEKDIADATEIILEFRGVTDNLISSFSTGSATNTDGWVEFTHSQKAPSGTRTIRVRLIATSNTIGDPVDGYFDDLSLTATNTLPVTLVSFTAASSSKGSSLLKWETTNEINNKGFYIERSVNGVSWETIGFVAAAVGNENNHQYRFTDEKPAVGINFYRFKQVDIDGKYEYSPTRNVSYQYSGRTVIFPNPADNILTIVTRESRFKAQIINLSGKVVASADNQKNIITQQLPSGVYNLRLIYDNRVENLRFIKR